MELKPTKFGITPGKERPVDGTNTPDQFGQVNNNQSDATSLSGQSARQVNVLHTHSDVDSSPQSQHHTLGTQRNQSSPGDHIHDGVSSKKLGAMAINTSGTDLVPAFTLTGSKGGNVALTNLLTFLAKHFNFTDNTT